MSQLDSVSERLGEHDFEVFKLDPLTSLDALNVVKDVVAPAIGSALGSVDSLSQLRDIVDGGVTIGPAIENLLANATVERQRQLISVFRKVTHVDGAPLGDRFDLIFRGDLPLMFDWLRFCFKAEWGNVGGAIGSGIGAAIAQVEPLPKSQNISDSNGRSSTSPPSGKSRRSRRSRGTGT